MEKRIFIGGPPRSGTTLIMYILNNHPSIGIIPETKLFEIYDNEKDDIIRLENIIPFRRNPIKNEVFKDPKNLILDPKKYVNFLQKRVWEWEKYNKYKLINILNKVKCDNPKKVLETLLLNILSNKLIKGEKTPINVLHYNTIRRYYPKSYFIQMIRNPYACFSSELKKSKQNPTMIQKIKSLIDGCRIWNQIARLGKEREIKDKLYKIIKFEELIEFPEKTIKDLCNFLNINFTNVLLDVIKVNSSFEGNYMTNKSFDKEAIDGWKDNLSNINKKIISLACYHKHIYNY